MTTEEDKQLARFLDLSYRRRVLGQPVQPDSVLEDDDTFVAVLPASFLTATAWRVHVQMPASEEPPDVP